MKSITAVVLGMMMILGTGRIAPAFDLPALDRVTVQMAQTEVHAILGRPHQVSEVEDGLELNLYRSSSLEPMLGTGCIFGHDERLVGQSFVFEGELGRQTVERLQEIGFTLTDQQGDAFRLVGQDDDTGRPLIVHILQTNGLTIVMTFDKDFYERRGKWAN